MTKSARARFQIASRSIPVHVRLACDERHAIPDVSLPPHHGTHRSAT